MTEIKRSRDQEIESAVRPPPRPPAAAVSISRSLDLSISFFSIPRVEPEDLPAGALFDVFDKLDGHRLILAPGQAWRRGRSRNLWPVLAEPIRALAERCQLILDGELMAPGRTAADVTRTIARAPERLTFHPFAIVGAQGPRGRGAEGRATLEPLTPGPLDPSSPAAEHLILRRLGWQPPAYFGRYTGRQIRRCWLRWSGEVAEGVVLRPIDNGPGWLKIKRPWRE